MASNLPGVYLSGNIDISKIRFQKALNVVEADNAIEARVS